MQSQPIRAFGTHTESDWKVPRKLEYNASASPCQAFHSLLLNVPDFLPRHPQHPPVHPKFLPTTDWDWTIDPMGIRMCCREITSRYDLPVVISENGLGAFDKLEDGQIHDPYRIDYLKRHIEELKKACDDGCRVLAYCTWSYTDLLSWLNGYQKRYGFVYVDREEDENSGTLNRYKKDSYYWYKKVIETNGEEL